MTGGTGQGEPVEQVPDCGDREGFYGALHGPFTEPRHLAQGGHETRGGSRRIWGRPGSDQGSVKVVS